MVRKLKMGLLRGNNHSPNKKNGNNNKGNCEDFLMLYSGLHVDGYEPGKAVDMPKIKEYDRYCDFYSAKPWQLRNALFSGELDLILCGSDTIEEGMHQRRIKRIDYNSDDRIKKLLTERYGSGNSSGKIKSHSDLWNGWKRFLLTRDESCLNKEDKKIYKERTEILRLLRSYENSGQEECPFMLLEDLEFGAVDIYWQVPQDMTKLQKKLELAKDTYQREAWKNLSKTHKFKIATEYPGITHLDVLNLVTTPVINLESRDSTYDDKTENGLTRQLIDVNQIHHEIMNKNYQLDILFRPNGLESLFGEGFNFDLGVGAISTGTSMAQNGLMAIGKPLFKSSVGLYSRIPLGQIAEESMGEEDPLNVYAEIVKEMRERFKEGKVLYGKDEYRTDSRLNPNFGAWKKDGDLYKPCLKI